MKLELKEFQVAAIDDLMAHLRSGAREADSGSQQAIVLSAPTGSGKTVIATTVIERLFVGDAEQGPDDAAVVLWLSDQPELNEQTRQKIFDTSDVIGKSSVAVIDSSFDQKTLLSHRVYFLNTQKLAKDARLVTYGDKRAYTIWDTIRNTIDVSGGHFCVFIDEAHRGMAEDRNGRAQAASIVQRFIKGSPGEIPPVPLIVGISATPDRFQKLLAGTPRIQRPINIDPRDVRASGLLKEIITLYYPTEEQPRDISMLRAAAEEWVKYRERWAVYGATQGEELVEPILVVQVADATKTRISSTPLSEVIDAINDQVGPFPANAFAHAFQEGSDVSDLAHKIRYLAPSQIAADPDVKVVFFKSSLNTGWDCPRAEVMMSFRKAKDSTLIAQLVGRMVRAPLARRIDADEHLNTVALYLPHYDEKGLKQVVDRLSADDADIMPPTRVQLGAETETLTKRAGTEAIFHELENVPNFVVPKRRKTSAVRRLMKLARALANDHLDKNAVGTAQDLMIGVLNDALKGKTKSKAFKELVAEKGKISLRATEATLAGHMTKGVDIEIDASDENINDLFHAAGRRVGEGLHKVWWRRRVGRKSGSAVMRRAKLEVFALAADNGVITQLGNSAQRQVGDWLKRHRKGIARVAESRKQQYADVRGMAQEPEPAPIEYPPAIVTRKSGPAWGRHLYVDDNEEFHSSLNKWEIPVIQAELDREAQDVVGWLRNPDRKPWSFTIAYEMDGVHRPLYPDFLLIRDTEDGLVVDILDPHAPGLEDSPFKAVGLAQYARDHGHKLGRIELISVDADGIRRLDLQDEATRKRVLKVRDQSHLKDLYDNTARD